jgi:hypothetical protein
MPCRSARLRLDPALVEEAVFQSFRGAARPAEERRWNAEREEIYLLPVAERGAAFEALGLRWFRGLGLERVLERCVERVPHVRQGVREVRLKRAQGRREEGSELYQGADGMRFVLSIVPARFATPDALEALVVHELLRAEDMLDPAFAYRPQARGDLVPGDPRAELVRDRMRVLWELRLRGRAARLLGRASVERGRRELGRAFGGLPGDELVQLEERAHSGRLASFPELLHAAGWQGGTTDSAAVLLRSAPPAGGSADQ